MRVLLIFLIYGGAAVFGGSVCAQGPTEQWRPAFHFTPLANWTNDPNGPLYLHGEWLVYNQQNPFENKWGHMSWGHASSTDLVHWKHLPVAIPEKIAGSDTTWIFSGSAVWDEHNTSGFCKDGGCIVAIYTAHQPNLHKESQYIAYSNDGGLSFTNYTGNPVIDLDKRDFRDPNVFWHGGSGQWVMAVSMTREHQIRLYGSPNLREWKMLSDFGPAGYTGSGFECPSLFELPVEGSPGVKKWVMMNSVGGGKRGTFMQYWVGDFDGSVFHSDNPPDTVLPVDYGDCFYAAIPWNNAPAEARILVGWMVPGVQKTFPWTGQFSIPRDMSLRRTPAGLRLVQEPAAVVLGAFDRLPASSRHTVASLAVGAAPVALHGLTGNTWMLDAELTPSPGGVAGFKIGEGSDGTGTVIGYDAASHQLYVDRSNSGPAKIRPGVERQVVEVGDAGGGGSGSGDGRASGGRKVRLRLLMDKGSLEVFVNGGEKVLTTYVYPEEGATGVSAFATGGKAVIKDLKTWDLSKL